VDLLVLPVLQEAFGDVILEALGSGVPVITTPEVVAAEQARKIKEKLSWESHFQALENHLMEVAKLDKREDLT